jgi:hypothetical protein
MDQLPLELATAMSRDSEFKEFMERYPEPEPIQVQRLKAQGVFSEPEGALKTTEQMEQERQGRIYVNHEIGWI